MNDLRKSIENYTERKSVSEPIYTVQGLEKQAGIFVHQPTIDRMSDKVREYVMNETAFFHKRYPIDVHIQPTEMQDTKSGNYIKNGEGIASLNMAGNILEFPFHVRDSEFDPFFVINHKKESVPFTRDNLKRVMHGIEKAIEETKDGGKSGRDVVDGYKSLAKKVTPATAAGFLASGVSFKNEQKSKRGPQMMSLAANTDLDNMIEKLATMEEFTMEKKAFLEDKITERLVAAEFKKSMEKIASTESTPSVYDKVENLNFIDLSRDSRVKHGDSVEVPVYERDINKGYYSSYVSKTGMFIQLGNIKGVLCANAEFIPINGPTLGLKVKTKVSLRRSAIKNLASTDLAIVGVNGKYDTIVGLLCNVTKKQARGRFTERAVENRLDSAFVETSVGKKGTIIPDNKTLIKVSLQLDDYPTHTLESFSAIDVPGLKKLRKYTGDSMASDIADDIIKSGTMKYSDFQENNILDCFPSRAGVAIVGDLNNLKVIPLRASSVNTFRAKSEIFDLFDSTADMSMRKSASRETVSVKRDLDSGKYDVAIDYKDPSKKIFKGTNRSLYGLEPEKLKGVLTYLGYDDMSADSIKHRAEKARSTSHTLPSNHKARDINVGDVESRARSKARKIADSAVRSGVPTVLAGTAAYTIVRELNEINKDNPRAKAKVQTFNNIITGKYGTKPGEWKQASELSASMSGQFEKVAQDLSSPFAFKVAKTMNISSRYFDKIAEVEGGKIYNIKDASKDILNAKDDFNKVACRLVDLHESQLNRGEHTIDSRMIKEAIEHIDLMLKFADEAMR